jgi:Holliday junction resolvase RusA-like endonuclease
MTAQLALVRDDAPPAPGSTRALVFFAAGAAKPKGSHKPWVYRGKDGKHRASQAGDSPEEKGWRATVAAAAVAAMRSAGLRPLEGCVDLELAFIIGPRPKDHFLRGQVRASAPPRPGKKPDYDKLARSVGDALNGIVYVDDAQVVRATVEKLYTSEAQPFVGVRITVRPFVGA